MANLKLRRNFLRKSRLKLFLITAISFLIIVFYLNNHKTHKQTFLNIENDFIDNTMQRAKPINSNCMPIEIKIETYENRLKNVDKRKHVKCNEDDWVKVENDGTVKYNSNYLDTKNLNISKHMNGD